MKTLMLTITLLTCVTQVNTVNFDDLKTGAPPPGWTATKTGTGEAKWTVEKDETAPSPPNVLKQSGQATYPVCIKDDTSLKDGFVEVKFKPISGKEDQAGGLLARIQDKDNYYILRANALEGNVNLYKYAGGKRSALKEGTARVPAGQWQHLRFEVSGNHLRGFLNDQLVVETTDDTYQAGKVGLWTKADSTACFDDVEVKGGSG